ncbi:MAG: ROK family protein [Synergistaceae bacterium]|nr:ROK family protein [Synergistota bacterium]NLM72379.1 ROK family protein [Synergistaceae bacterium]
MRERPLVGGIEAGGTKIVCAVGRGPDDLTRAVFPSGSDPETALGEVLGWLLAEQARRGLLRAVGIGSFGPVDLDRASPRYGFITSTPKQGWRDTDVLGRARRAFANVPVAFDTDVNAAALGERRWGAAKGLDDFVYITIGTGIGAGVVTTGKPVHGLVHPEAGHMRIPRFHGDGFPGVCPYHGDCWEGLCSGPAMKARTGMAATEISPDSEAWTLEARYTALALGNIVCTLSPRRIILGGSVPKGGLLGAERFFAMVRADLRDVLNGYVVSPSLEEGMDEYIVPPGLGDDAGVCGALALALDELDRAGR